MRFKQRAIGFKSFMFSYRMITLLLRPCRGAEYCDQFVCLSVCVSVCPRAYLWNHWTSRSKRATATGDLHKKFVKIGDLHEFFVKIPCGRGSVFLWRRCDTGLMSMNALLNVELQRSADSCHSDRFLADHCNNIPFP